MTFIQKTILCVVGLLCMVTGYAQNNENSEIIINEEQLKKLIEAVAKMRVEKLHKQTEKQIFVRNHSFYLQNTPYYFRPERKTEQPQQITNIEIISPNSVISGKKSPTERSVVAEIYPKVVTPTTDDNSALSTTQPILSSTDTNTYNRSDLQVVAPKQQQKDITKPFEPVHKPMQIYFNNNSTEVAPSFLPLIDQIELLLRQNEKLVVVLEGYASSDGNKTYNQIISMKRALSVKQLLQEKGIAPNRIISSFKGEDLSERKNFARRVDISFIEN